LGIVTNESFPQVSAILTAKKLSCFHCTFQVGVLLIFRQT
jgi:hypothetical protein